MREQISTCIKAQLMAKSESEGYTKYVFQDLVTMKFIMCTRCPNWNGSVELLQEGYLSYMFVQAGKDTWYSNRDNKYYAYQHTANYFQDFVPITHVLSNGFVVDKTKLIVT